MTDISSHHPVPDTSNFLFVTLCGNKDAEAKADLTLLTEQYKAIANRDPSSKVAEDLRKKMDKRIEEINLIQAKRDIVLRDVFRGYKQPSLETAQTRKGKGDF